MTVAQFVEPNLIPFQPIHELQLYKVGKFWAFDMPEYGVEQELLVGGTDETLDIYFETFYQRPARDGDVLKTRIYNGDHVTPERYGTELRFAGEDKDEPDSSYYVDIVTHTTCWLCPFLLTLWQEPPSSIYVDFKWRE